MKSLLCIFFAICTYSVTAAEPDDSTQAVEVLRKSTNVTPIKADPPVYPLKALKLGIEGWVVLKFVVKADGTTDDIEVFDSSIEGYFDEAAIKATRNRVYQPATINGEPVMRGNVFLRSIFQITSSDGGVSKSFLRYYRKASKALDEGQLDEAKSLIDKLDTNDKRLLAEVCYLDMLKARYYTKTGDDKATLRFVERALVIADDVASKSVYIHLLRQAIVHNSKINNFQTSLEYYQTLMEVDENLSPDDPLHNYMMRVKQVVNGEESILTHGEVSRSCKFCEDSSGFWSHILNRNQFSIDQVAGQLTEIKIVCQNSSVTVSYSPEIAWTVNQDDGDCSIRVFGDMDTSFRLIELANKDTEN